MNRWYLFALAEGQHDSDEYVSEGNPSHRQHLVWVAHLLVLWEKFKYDIHHTRPRWAKNTDGGFYGALSRVLDLWIGCADVLGACGETLEGPAAEPDTFASDPWACLLGRAAAFAGRRYPYAAALRGVMFQCSQWYNNQPNLNFDHPTFGAALGLKADEIRRFVK